MLIIKKTLNSNRWDYPDAPRLFSAPFHPADNPGQLVVTYNGLKTLAQLNASVPYVVVEYIGSLPASADKKLVGMGALGELLPDLILVELEDFKNTQSTALDKRQTAARVLTRINSNVKVDVMHVDFIALMGNLSTYTSLTVGQASSIINELRR